jgi:hypothetical protein
MLKRFFLAVLLLIAAGRAAAVDYTDIWYIPAEAGWGVNVVEARATPPTPSVMFLTFFIYGPDGKPTWYVATVTQDVTGNFNGPLFSTTGTSFALPWVPGPVLGAQVGTASFQPTGPSTANLVYTLNSGPILASVTKAIQRQTLTVIPLAGNGANGAIYSGGLSGAYSGCTTSSTNAPFRDFFDLQVTQVPNGTTGTLTFAIAYTDITLSCVLSGTYQQNGQLYSIPSATYQCSDGLNTMASMSEIKLTGQGVEGRFSAPSVGGNCREDSQFSAVAD